MSTVTVLETTHLGTATGPVELIGGAEYDSAHPLVVAYPGLFSAPTPEPVAAEPVVPAPRRATRKLVEIAPLVTGVELREATPVAS
jgi:hypothetical protein